MYSQQTFLSNGLLYIVHSHFLSCSLEWWDVRMPGAFLEHFRFARHIIHIYVNIYFKISMSLVC